MKMSLLKFLLFAAGIGWGISLLGVVLNEDSLIVWLSEMAAVEFEKGAAVFYPIVIYWIRMASIVFSLVGLFFIIVASQPKRFRNSIPYIGGFNCLVGIVLLVNGIQLGLFQIRSPAYLDVSFCLGTGMGIVILYYYSKAELDD